MNKNQDTEKPLVFSGKFTHICERCAKLDPVKWRFCTHISDANSRFKNWETIRKWEGEHYECSPKFRYSKVFVDVKIRDDEEKDSDMVLASIEAVFENSFHFF